LLDQIPFNLDDIKKWPVGLFFPPTIFISPSDDKNRKAIVNKIDSRNVPFKLLHSFHSILYHSVGFKMAILPIIQEDIIYDDESVFERGGSKDQEKAQSEASLCSYGILHSKFIIQIEPYLLLDTYAMTCLTTNATASAIDIEEWIK
jgi:hypothetical protein